MKTALIAGATGLVGSFLLPMLLASGRYRQVFALLRRSTGITNPLLQEVVTDFTQLTRIPDTIFAVNDMFCCLGTTIKQAGTKEAFRVVDYEYPLTLAERGRAQGISRFSVISAIGADVRSPFFYSRVKGELEQALVWLNFRDLQIFRPSLLLGKRSENRIAERTAAMLEPLYSPLLVGPLAKYRPVYAETVARAMNEAAKWEGNGATWYDTVDIDRLAKGR